MLELFGLKTRIVETRLLHFTKGMHDALRRMGGQGSVGVGSPIECCVTREAAPEELAAAFARVLDPARERMRRPESCTFYTRIEDPATLCVEYGAVALEGLDADHPETHPNHVAHEAVAFASGMGAIFATIMASTRHGDNVIMLTPVYGCTMRLSKLLKDLGRTVTWVPIGDLAALQRAIRPETTVIYGEIMSNPTLRFLNVPEISALTRAENLRPRPRPLKFIVDTTFVPPLGFRGFEHGVDAVIVADTKFHGGFGEYCAGTVVAPQALVFGDNDNGLLSGRHLFGAVLNPFEARQLASQGFTTLFVRIRYYEAMAGSIAEQLANDPRIEKIVYPGLHTYPDRAISEPILRDYDGLKYNGSMIYLEVKGSTPEEARERGFRLMKYLHKKGWVNTVAVSLGAIRSLIEHPASMTHSAYSVEELAANGISPGGIRLSIGMEDCDIFVEEFKVGLDFAFSDRSIESLG
jgi:cystathionine beta-lyase/cystathionine gamma-synthase